MPRAQASSQPDIVFEFLSHLQILKILKGGQQLTSQAPTHPTSGQVQKRSATSTRDFCRPITTEHLETCGFGSQGDFRCSPKADFLQSSFAATMEQPACIFRLPIEIWHEIGRYLPFRDFANIAQTCKALRNHLKGIVWKNVCFARSYTALCKELNAFVEANQPTNRMPGIGPDIWWVQPPGVSLSTLIVSYNTILTTSAAMRVSCSLTTNRATPRIASVGLTPQATCISAIMPLNQILGPRSPKPWM